MARKTSDTLIILEQLFVVTVDSKRREFFQNDHLHNWFYNNAFIVGVINRKSLEIYVKKKCFVLGQSP